MYECWSLSSVPKLYNNIDIMSEFNLINLKFEWNKEHEARITVKLTSLGRGLAGPIEITWVGGAYL